MLDIAGKRMARYSKRRYQLHVIVLMVVYLLLIFFEWPYAVHAAPGWQRAVLALLPALPVVGVFALMARYVMRSDEMEKQIHLVALSVATGVVCAACLLLGFLLFAKALVLDGQIVFWVPVALAIIYAVARVLAVHRYTGTWKFWAC